MMSPVAWRRRAPPSSTPLRADREETNEAYEPPIVPTTTAIDVLGTRTTTESEVIEIRRGPIPASAWEIPAGYTKVENPMLKAFEGKGRSRR